MFPSRRHAAVAVDLRRVVQNAGRLVREKVGEECLCVVSDSARRTTWRDEDEVSMFMGDTQTMCLSRASAWRSMCDCTL